MDLFCLRMALGMCGGGSRLRGLLRRFALAGSDAGAVLLAFLELMEPDLPTAVGSLVSDGCSVVTVVPVFFGQGGHVRRDHLRCSTFAGRPILASLFTVRPPSVRMILLDAVADYCLRQSKHDPFTPR